MASAPAGALAFWCPDNLGMTDLSRMQCPTNRSFHGHTTRLPSSAGRPRMPRGLQIDATGQERREHE